LIKRSKTKILSNRISAVRFLLYKEIGHSSAKSTPLPTPRPKWAYPELHKQQIIKKVKCRVKDIYGDFFYTADLVGQVLDCILAVLFVPGIAMGD
jgi:hypothetical protein